MRPRVLFGMMFAAAVLSAAAVGPASAAANEETELTIVIEDHFFDPQLVEIPADTRVKLIVENRDPTPEEFESNDLNVEKIIPGNSKVSLWLGPLEKGRYNFIGEFHMATAKGILDVIE